MVPKDVHIMLGGWSRGYYGNPLVIGLAPPGDVGSETPRDPRLSQVRRHIGHLDMAPPHGHLAVAVAPSSACHENIGPGGTDDRPEMSDSLRVESGLLFNRRRQPEKDHGGLPEARRH